MQNDALIWDRLQVLAAKRTPGLRIAYKDESLIQRMLGVVVGLYNPGYMTSFATTWGKTIYFPSRAWAAQNTEIAWTLLAHESVHVYDAAQVGLLRYTLGYAFPQILAVLALLAPLGLLWAPLWGLLLFLVALRLPSDARLAREVRGYTANFAAKWWTGRMVTSGEVHTYAAWLSGSTYLWAARTDDVARARLVVALQAVQNGALVEQEGSWPYLDLAEALSHAGALLRSVRGIPVSHQLDQP